MTGEHLMAFNAFVILFMLWMYHEAAAKVLNRALPIVIGIFLFFLMAAGSISYGAFLTEDVALLEWLNGVIAVFMYIWAAAILAPYILLWVWILMASATDGIVDAFIKAKTEKKKGIPQSLGERLELHDDGNPFIDLRYAEETHQEMRR